MTILASGIIDSLLEQAQFKRTDLTPAELKKLKEKLLNRDTSYGKWFSQIEAMSDYRGPREYLAEEILRGGDYDTAGAMKAGIEPSPYEHDTAIGGEKAYHWPSRTSNGTWLKDPKTHESAWMEVFMEVTGKDPHEMGIQDKSGAEEYLAQNREKLPALKKLLEKGGNRK